MLGKQIFCARGSARRANIRAPSSLLDAMLAEHLRACSSSNEQNYIIYRKIDIEIADRKIYIMFNKYRLCALNLVLTQETQDAYKVADICNTMQSFLVNENKRFVRFGLLQSLATDFRQYPPQTIRWEEKPYEDINRVNEMGSWKSEENIRGILCVKSRILLYRLRMLLLYRLRRSAIGAQCSIQTRTQAKTHTSKLLP
uniref:Uncharacterized protein n=1 Tax=Romanomermis culicivorax TaxID=13658 RepID=A0A915IZ54_ROMCU